MKLILFVLPISLALQSCGTHGTYGRTWYTNDPKPFSSVEAGLINSTEVPTSEQDYDYGDN